MTEATTPTVFDLDGETYTIADQTPEVQALLRLITEEQEQEREARNASQRCLLDAERHRVFAAVLVQDLKKAVTAPKAE